MAGMGVFGGKPFSGSRRLEIMVINLVSFEDLAGSKKCLKMV